VCINQFKKNIMALGKVTTINPDNITGTITEDESGQTYGFNDPNFPNTGLVVGSPCTYDIDYTQRTPIATNLASYTATERDITTAVSGPITVNVGETLKVKNGGVVTGTVVVNNGNLFVQGTGQVNGDVTVNAEGSAIVRNGGVITGTVVVSSGSVFKVKNGGMIRGNIDVTKANRVIIGDADGGGNIYGSVTINKIRKVTITATSKINC
jgi:autotransporter passenger strand-loop-strand repeat protein